MKIKYTGVVAYQELPLTKIFALWQPGQSSDVEYGSRLSLLMGTGLFSGDEIADDEFFITGNYDPVTGGIDIPGVLKVIGQSAVPTILLPAGTWANTSGQLTVGSALPYLPAGVVKVYLFASGIAAAGLYYATFTGSAASPVCQVWNEAEAITKPTTTAGAYAPAPGSVVWLAILTVPANKMGIHGRLLTEAFLSMPTSANIKRVQILYGGTAFKNVPVTTNISLSLQSRICNRGTNNSQFAFQDGSPTDLGAGATTTMYTAIDTGADQTLAIAASIANAAEFVILEAYRVVINPLA